MHQNASKMIADYGDTTTYGVWVITGTYSVKRCALTVLTSKDAEAKVGLDLQAANVGTIAPSASWWTQKSSEAWNIYDDVSSLSLQISIVHDVDDKLT
jgi:hypothetical protein